MLVCPEWVFIKLSAALAMTDDSRFLSARERSEAGAFSPEEPLHYVRPVPGKSPLTACCTI